MKKPITTALLKSLLNQCQRDEITFSRMVEVLNEEVEKAYEVGKDNSYFIPESEGQFEKSPKISLDDIDKMFKDFKESINKQKELSLRQEIDNLKKRVEQLEISFRNS